MQIENRFVVPVAVDRAWAALLDVEQVVQCLPGASLTAVDGDRMSGSVTVRLGPVTMVYRGEAEFVVKDSAEKRLVMEGSGRDQRGAGNVKSSVEARLLPSDEGTEVWVVADLALTGKPAQLGRGVISQVSDRLVGEFASRLAVRLREAATPLPEGAQSAATADCAPVSPPQARSAPPPQEPELLDMLDLVDGKRGMRWAAGGFATLALLLAVRRRWRRS